MQDILTSQLENAGAGYRVWPDGAAARLKKAVSATGNQAEVAVNAGISRSALASILNGHATPKPETLARICQAIGVPVAAIISSDPGGGLVYVREIDLSYGMGSTWLDGVPVTEEARQFPSEWIRQFTRTDPAKLFFARGAGDSMMPTIYDGDVVLVDTAQQAPSMADRIWVLTWSGMGMIKRLRGQPDGGLHLSSDNPTVSPVVAYDGEAQIIGRVVAVIRKM